MTEITDIDIRDIKPFVSRARPRGPFERMKESIRAEGLKMPVQVRRIKDPKFKYERIVGEGRILAHRELKRWLIPAIVVDVPEGEIVGRFLAENVMRRKLSWQEKASLIRDEVSGKQMTRALLSSVAERYYVTPAHVAKLLRILQQASPKVGRDLDSLTVEEAETLTSLPATGQEITLEVMRDERLDRTQLTAVVRKAQELTQDAEGLSKHALKQSLKRVDEDVKRIRESLKLKRLHWSLGPENLKALLSDVQFRKALDRRNINYKKFVEAT